ncbi:MAG: hypothetical protein WC956_06470 [bacterium]
MRRKWLDKQKAKMSVLDNQMRPYASDLLNKLKINRGESNRLATTIANQVRSLSFDEKLTIQVSSPVNLKKRIEELIAFQKWMEIVNSSELAHNPAIVRAQVIVQNYICFVYLNENCFKILKRYLPKGSCAKKCCDFLTNNPVRAFRNAFAHSNWCYKDDFSGIVFWAKKGADPAEEMIEWEVNQEDLSFWQALARCVAYVVYENL